MKYFIFNATLPLVLNLDNRKACSNSKEEPRLPSYGAHEDLWSDGVVVKVLDSQSRGPVLKTTGLLLRRSIK